MGTLEAGQSVAMLATAYPVARLDDRDRTALYVRMLADVPGEVLKVAVQKLICTATFCPTVAEIRSACAEMTCAVSLERTAGEAWAAVLEEIDRTGYYRAPCFDDPLIGRAVQCTARWRDLCRSELSDMPAHRARFLQAYEHLVGKVRSGAVLPEVLVRQIEACKAEHLSGALDDARPAHKPISSAVSNLLKDVGEARKGSCPSLSVDGAGEGEHD